MSPNKHREPKDLAKNNVLNSSMDQLDILLRSVNEKAELIANMDVEDIDSNELVDYSQLLKNTLPYMSQIYSNLEENSWELEEFTRSRIEDKERHMKAINILEDSEDLPDETRTKAIEEAYSEMNNADREYRTINTIKETVKETQQDLEEYAMDLYDTIDELAITIEILGLDELEFPEEPKDGSEVLEVFYDPEIDLDQIKDPEQTKSREDISEAELMEEYGRQYQEFGFDSYAEMADSVEEIAEY